jgi:hypothetical protein
VTLPFESTETLQVERDEDGRTKAVTRRPGFVPLAPVVS